MPLYVPVGVAFGTLRPQKMIPETLLVEVGEVNVYPATVAADALSAVDVPGYVKVEVEYPCELVAMELEPEVSVA